jgi:hypothetical protein
MEGITLYGLNGMAACIKSYIGNEGGRQICYALKKEGGKYE